MLGAAVTEIVRFEELPPNDMPFVGRRASSDE
jgi:hypothetical protein